jgi:DNA-binding PadR family transcriptional regulator
MLGKTKIRILEEVSMSPTHGYALSRKLGISVSSIYDHLKDLERAGLVRSASKLRRRDYQITRNGQLLLRALNLDIEGSVPRKRGRSDSELLP